MTSNVFSTTEFKNLQVNTLTFPGVKILTQLYAWPQFSNWIELTSPAIVRSLKAISEQTEKERRTQLWQPKIKLVRSFNWLKNSSIRLFCMSEKWRIFIIFVNFDGFYSTNILTSLPYSKNSNNFAKVNRERNSLNISEEKFICYILPT